MRILIIQTGYIGDVVISTPVYSKLKELFPNSQIDLLTTKIASSLFEADPRFNQVIVYDKRAKDKGLSGFYSMLKSIKQNNYDKVFSLHKSIRTSLLVFLSNAKESFGFKEASLSFLYSKTSSRSDLKHDALRNLALLRTINLDPEKNPLPLSLNYAESTQVKIKEYIQNFDKPLVGIAPGSVWATKRWTIEGFADVARFLSDRGYQVLVIGGPEDRDKAAKIIEQVKEVKSACGEFSLAESACLISKLKFLISNDSSPLHMASAGQTPVIALFCATVPEFGYGPWMVSNRVLGVENLNCRPCASHGGNICPTGTNYCQIKLESKSVKDAIVSLEQEIENETSRNSN